MKITNRMKSWFLIILLMSTSLLLMAFTTMDTEEHHHHVLIAKLSGEGDVDGKGRAKIIIMMDEAGNHSLCWDIKVKDITLPSLAAHIHLGVEGTTGPIVVSLSAPDARGFSSGCTFIEHDLAMNLHMNPEQYYVNVHTTDYPGGAVRGQLTLAEE